MASFERNPKRRLLRFLPPLCFVALAVGCPAASKVDYSSLGLVEVSGTVRMNGKPLAGVTVIFEGEERDSSRDTTDEAGRYHLMYTSEKSGVTPGKKTVRIRFDAGEGDDGEGADAEDETGRTRKSKQNIPERYNTKSELFREVKSGGGPQSFDFNLTGG